MGAISGSGGFSANTSALFSAGIGSPIASAADSVCSRADSSRFAFSSGICTFSDSAVFSSAPTSRATVFFQRTISSTINTKSTALSTASSVIITGTSASASKTDRIFILFTSFPKTIQITDYFPFNYTPLFPALSTLKRIFSHDR